MIIPYFDLICVLFKVNFRKYDALRSIELRVIWGQIPDILKPYQVQHQHMIENHFQHLETFSVQRESFPETFSHYNYRHPIKEHFQLPLTPSNDWLSEFQNWISIDRPWGRETATVRRIIGTVRVVRTVSINHRPEKVYFQWVILYIVLIHF